MPGQKYWIISGDHISRWSKKDVSKSLHVERCCQCLPQQEEGVIYVNIIIINKF